MKTEALKKIIKEAVREAIQEELKEVLLEAVKSPKQFNPQPVQENTNIPSTPPPSKPTSLLEKRQQYANIIGETGLTMNSTHARGWGNKPFNPQGLGDTTSAKGGLPDGEVNMDQIMGLMAK